MPARTTLLAALCVLALVGGLLPGAGLGAQEAPDYRLDDGTGLTDQQTIETYEREGRASVEVTTPRLTITVAEEAAACNTSVSAFSDLRNDYLCVRYHSELPTSVRFHVPEAYWQPYVRETKQSVADPAEARFAPVANASATAVTISFDGRTTAVYPIPEDVTATYAVLEQVNERATEIAGIELWSSGTQWRTISAANRTGDQPYARIAEPHDELVLQYDASPSETEATWLRVPSEQGDSAPVYWFEREAEAATYVVIETNESIDLRYRKPGGIVGELGAAMDRLASVDDWVEQRLDGLLEGLPFVGDGGES